jgi:DME family drug/metabolite transporter
MSTPSVSTPSVTAARRGFLLVVLAAACWGTAGFSGRLVQQHSDLGALDIAWYRMAIATVVLLAARLLSRRRTVPPVARTRPVVVRLVLIGAGLGGYQLAYFAAVARAGVSISTLVALGLAPLFVAVATIVLGHGRPAASTLLCLLTALAGLGLLVGLSAGAGAGTAVLLGALLAVGSALGYALVVICGAGVPAGVPVNLVAFAGGALLLTPVALIAGLRLPSDATTIGLLLYLGAVPSALAYRFFFTGIRAVPGPVASIVTLMEPVTATVLATAFLHERLATGALLGGLLVLAAVAALYLRQLRGAEEPLPGASSTPLAS